MRLAATAVVFLCVAGVALALDESDPPSRPTAAAFEPHWEQDRPRGGRIFPRSALERGLSGVTHLCCSARPDRTLACEVAIEWPEDEGFGRFARRYIEPHRLTPESYAELQMQPSARVHLAFLYEVSPAPARLGEVAEQIRAGAANLCAPNSGPAPDYIVVEAQRLN